MTFQDEARNRASIAKAKADQEAQKVRQEQRRKTIIAEIAARCLQERTWLEARNLMILTGEIGGVEPCLFVGRRGTPGKPQDQFGEKFEGGSIRYPLGRLYCGQASFAWNDRQACTNDWFSNEEIVSEDAGEAEARSIFVRRVCEIFDLTEG